MDTQVSSIRKFARVEMSLHHVLYVSYLVPESRVRQLVPGVLQLAVVDRDKVFVSIVILQSAGVGLSSLPFPKFTYNQINIRTYVLDPHSGQQAVFFLRSGVTSSVISLLTRSIGIPWQHISVELETSTDKKGNYQSYNAGGIWGQPFSIIAEGAPEQPMKIAPFEDADKVISYLIRPLMGFFGQNGKARGFRIWHPEVKPHCGLLKQIHFPVLNSLNLVDEPAMRNPDSILLIPDAHFYIYMPPKRVTRK